MSPPDTPPPPARKREAGETAGEAIDNECNTATRLDGDYDGEWDDPFALNPAPRPAATADAKWGKKYEDLRSAHYAQLADDERQGRIDHIRSQCAPDSARWALADIEVDHYARREAEAQAKPGDLGGLRFEDVADVVARVKAKPPRQWLSRGVIIAATHVATIAEDTAGKGLSMSDLAVNVATGGAWMGLFQCDDPGPVLVLVGEDDEDEWVRRGEAVAAFYGHRFEELPIRFCARVPQLTDEAQINAVRWELDQHPAKLVILDPMYLALGGKVQTSQLAEVGAALAPLQYACRDLGAALMVVHHWNKTGTGTGRHRATGAGVPEWARMTASVTVQHRGTDGDATVVTQQWEFIGNGIVDRKVRLRRKVWADDPNDLSSPLNYEIEQLVDLGGDSDGTGRPPSETRTLAILTAADAPLTSHQIGDRLAEDGTGIPLKRRTIQSALKALEEDGLAHDDDPGQGYTPHWSVGPASNEVAA